MRYRTDASRDSITADVRARVGFKVAEDVSHSRRRAVGGGEPLGDALVMGQVSPAVHQ